MDEAEKRRLKKLGKQAVEQQSRERQAHLAEANPAPPGSEEWAQNYKAQNLRERELRRAPPDRIAGADAARDFVLNEIDPGSRFPAAPTFTLSALGVVTCCTPSQANRSPARAAVSNWMQRTGRSWLIPESALVSFN